MDSAFNQNQAELGIFILEKKVPLQPRATLTSQRCTIQMSFNKVKNPQLLLQTPRPMTKV